MSNFTKSRSVGVELFHADGRTDRYMTKLLVAFRNFANATNIWVWWATERQVQLTWRQIASPITPTIEQFVSATFHCF